MIRVAALQMASGPNISANLLEAGRLIAQAAHEGAKLIVLPEDFALMGFTPQETVNAREIEGKGPIQDFLAQHAARHAVWIVGGTLPLATDSPNKIRAACLVYDATGQRVARYDKIHLFDVYLEETGEKYTESRTIDPGQKTVVIDTPFGRLGLAVCYDLRFPELFRRLLDQGADLITLPAAFTAITGRAHWESLVRARAIENLCYVIAAAQGGYHLTDRNGRETYGDSMIVDPWGIVLERLTRGTGAVMATLDRGRLQAIRRNFPTINHTRLHCTMRDSSWDSRALD